MKFKVTFTFTSFKWGKGGKVSYILWMIVGPSETYHMRSQVKVENNTNVKIEGNLSEGWGNSLKNKSQTVK